MKLNATKDGPKAILRFGGTGKDHGGILLTRITTKWLTANKTGSNTVPVECKPDFKQALSTLQQLKQKEEGALQTSTNSRRNQQWAQSSSSSSSWWSWQGSWWTSCYNSESQGGEPSLE